MELKYTKPLIASSVINIALGAFLIISGILEFTGIMYTRANTVIKTVGVQLSYLVFISAILIFISGALTFFSRKKMERIDLQIFVGVIALAWPIFVSIALFFSDWIICVRLLPTTLASLFYMVTIMVVKIANETLHKVHVFNPTAQIKSLGKRKQGIDVARVLNNQKGKVSTGLKINSIGTVLQKIKPKRTSASINTKMLYSGSRRRKTGGMGNFLYSGSRRRSKFRIRK